MARTFPTWKRALVTGASSGIGEAIARRLAISGTDLVLVARDQTRLEKLADELDDYHGARIEVLPADLCDRVQLGAVERRLAAAVDPVDLLVNCAGVGTTGQFADLPLEGEEAEIDLNVNVLVRLSHVAARTMKARAIAAGTAGGDGAPTGGILNVSSIASFQPGTRTATYAATKAFVTSFSQALHVELRPAGISVSCLCPGFTRTEFQARAGYDVPVPGLLWQDAEDVAAAGVTGVTRGRDVVVPGPVNKTMTATSRLVPLRTARWIAARVSAAPD
jgi:uncharacterized protein